jgi:signal transduction histidine kinase
MVTTGLCWFAGNFATVDADWLAWLSAHALFVYRGPLVELAITYPSGRRRSRLDGVVVAVAYGAAIVTPVWENEAAAITLACVFAAAAGASYVSAVGLERRERLFAWLATTFVGAAIAGGAIARSIGSLRDVRDGTVLSLELALCALALALLVGLLVRPWERKPIADLVVDLGQTRSGTLQTALARTLGDPTLRIGWWSRETAAFVDETGRTLELPPAGAGPTVTEIEWAGEQVAAVVHDPAVLADPALVGAVATAARLSGAHAQLQAEVRARLVELEESRRRLLHAEDAERQRLERRLHMTAQRRLDGLERLLSQARNGATPGDELHEHLDRAARQLEEVLAELRRLAHGLYPHALTERGLADALTSLTEQFPVPGVVAVGAERLPEQVAAAVYFFCSEALANVAKYASSASGVSIAVTVAEGAARVEVADDGGGGADPVRGSGLRGLADRLDALGGSLELESPAGGGTRLVGRLPLREST